MTTSNLSVGIPTYNQGSFIGETLESLLSQSVAPREIVVSENHSTDDTPEVLEKFRDRVRIVRPPEHLTMTANWNYLASQVSGEWFSLLSSDDIALPNFVQVLTRGTRRSDRAVLVKAAFQFIDGQGKVLRDKYFHNLRTITSPPDTLLEQLDNSKTSFAAFAIRKEAWEKAGRFSEQCYLEADLAMWYLLSPLGDFVYENEIVSQYRKFHRQPDAEKLRSPMWVKDDIALYTKIVPDVAAQLKVDEAVVRAATVRHCRKRLAIESETLGPGEREEVADLLNDWAIECGWETELAAFRQGKKIFRKPYGPFRRTISQTANAIRRAGRSLRTSH